MNTQRSKPGGHGVAKKHSNYRSLFTVPACANNASAGKHNSLFTITQPKADEPLAQKRSNVMNASQFISRAIVALFAVVLTVGLAFGQNLVITGTSSFSGSGTYNIKGNITNSGVAGATTLSGTVNLNGTGGQSVGTATNGAINFGTLNASGGTAKTLNVNSAVTSALTSDGSGTVVDIGTLTLTLSGTISNSNSGAFDFAEPTSTVTYNGSAQTLFGTNYGILNISGSGANTVGSALTAVGAVTQTGGTLSVTDDFTVNSASNASFATINTVSGTKRLLNSGSGTMSIATLSANAGTIEATGGTVQFTTAVTNDAGSIKGTGAALDFDVDVANAGGTVELNATGTATFAGNFSSNGTLTFPSGSIVTFDGAGQTIPGVSYGRLRTLGGGSTKLAAAAITVLDTVDNGGLANEAVTLDMSTYTHVLPVYSRLLNTNGTIQFGASNGVVVGTGTVEYNGTDQTIAGDASNKYATLVLSNSGSKTVAALAANTVHTSANLTVNGGITLAVTAGGFLNVDQNLTVNGTLNNGGTVTVGN